MPRRVVLAREVERPVLVLGSTQPTELVDGPAVRGREVVLARRRGGGGAVYLEPGAQLWVDAWIPRDDPLWLLDVSAAAEWVGTWWIDALEGLGPSGFSVHAGRAAPGELGDLVCFAGRGPGEVFHGARKVVGLTQWRAREGALFSSCAYVRWNPVPLLELMYVDAHVREGMTRDLASVAVGLAELDPPVTDLGRVRDRLIGSFPAFT
ncbi:MAG: lipoyl protein ligase domain-containing protein [Acidimicrobiales bacterium]